MSWYVFFSFLSTTYCICRPLLCRPFTVNVAPLSGVFQGGPHGTIFDCEWWIDSSFLPFFLPVPKYRSERATRDALAVVVCFEFQLGKALLMPPPY